MDCEGCRIRNTDYCMWFEKDLNCPCSICLVKVMCVASCEPLEKHRIEIATLKGDLLYVKQRQRIKL